VKLPHLADTAVLDVKDVHGVLVHLVAAALGELVMKPHRVLVLTDHVVQGGLDSSARARKQLTEERQNGIAPAHLPAAGGRAYSAQLAATGGTKPYTWSISAGSLPAGLTLHPATGAITGKPITSSQTTDFTVEVTDSEATPASATASESITVTTVPPAVTTTSLPAATDGAATGGITPYTRSLSGGSLPAGLTLHPNGTIFGTPKAGGTADFTVEVADSASPFETATASLSITVTVASLVVTTASNLPTAYTSRRTR
jgi:hypothetical protein